MALLRIKATRSVSSIRHPALPGSFTPTLLFELVLVVPCDDVKGVCPVSQMPPYSPYGQPYPYAPYPPPPAKKGLPVWLLPVLVGSLVVCVLGGVGAALAFPSLAGMFSGGLVGGPALPAHIGQSLNVNGMTVSLVSASIETEQTIFGTDMQTLTLSLHCWNQSTDTQFVSMDNWRLYYNGSTDYVTPAKPSTGCWLDPQQSDDVQMGIFSTDSGLHGHYVLQTDFTTPQGQPLGWTFNA